MTHPTDDELEAMAVRFVTPLDLAAVLKHAFLSGVVAARNIPAGDPCNGHALWASYEPYDPGPYARILAALDPAPDQGEWNAAIEAAERACLIVRGNRRDTIAIQTAEQCAAAVSQLRKCPGHD